MFKGILRGIFLACLLIQPTSTLLATADYFWLLQEYGIEKRSLADGSLVQEFASVYKPTAFSIKPKQQGVWAVADGYLISFDADGNILNTTLLENVNEHAYLVSIPEAGVWLVHGNKRYAYNDEAVLVATLELPTTGNRIDDVAYDDENKRMWLVTDNTVIAIDQDDVISQFELKKNEKINGITKTKNGDIALIVTTPQPEFRLYTAQFELVVERALSNVSPSPVNLVETKDGKFWLAGKQHALLLDKDSGIIVNHEFNGELPQGPGEIQLITDNADNSAWLSVGRQLMHVSTSGDELHRHDESVKNIDLQKELRTGTPPVLRFLNISDTEDPQLISRLYPKSFKLMISDPEQDEDHASFVFTIGTKTPLYSHNVNLGHSAVFELDPRLSITCLSSALLYGRRDREQNYDEQNLYICHPYLLSLPSTPRPDEILTLSARMSDLEGNISNIASKKFILDTTPPEINKELISLDIEGDIATVSGKAGSVEPGTRVNIKNLRSQVTATITINEDGSFTHSYYLTYGPISSDYWDYTFKNYDGDNIELTFQDQAGNQAVPLNFKLEYEIKSYEIILNNLSPYPYQHLNTSFNITGTHNMQSSGEIIASYNGSVLAQTKVLAGDGNTFNIEGIKFSTEGQKWIRLDSKSLDGGYGLYYLVITVDTTPPSMPRLTVSTPTTGNISLLLIDVQDDIIHIQCKIDTLCYAEPASTMHITNTANGEMVYASVDESGHFAASIPGNRADLLEFYVEDAAGNTSGKVSLPAGKWYDNIRLFAYRDSELTQGPISYLLENGGVVPSHTFDKILVATGDRTGSQAVMYVNGVLARQVNQSSFSISNVTLNPDNTINVIYKDANGGYGETSITLIVDDIPPEPPVLELITLTPGINDLLHVEGSPGCVEPNTKVTIINTFTGEKTQITATEYGSFTARIYGERDEILSIYATDSVGNIGGVTQIPAGYKINITITEPKDIATSYYDAAIVRGYHDGPPGTVVYVGGGLAYEMNGNTFSGIAYLQPEYGVEDSSYTHTIRVSTYGPNIGFGYATAYFIKEVKPPNKDLIRIVYGDGTVTLIGETNAVTPHNSLTVINSTTNYSKLINSTTDGSFTAIISAEKGDVLTLIAIDEDDYKQSAPTILELGYLVDLAITTPLNGAEVSKQGLTVSGSHSGQATSIITVNGVQATVSESSFIAENVRVPESGLIEARLDDSDGAYGTASITVTLDTTPPPAPNLDLIDIAFSAGDSVRLRGQSGSVEAGATLTITHTTQDVSTSVIVADDGSFDNTYIAAKSGETLTLVATDTSDNQSAPATQQLGTEVMITIDTPTAGTSVLHNRLTVTGAHQGPINSGVVVNGVIAAVTENRFVALNVPVNADGTISATLSALDGSHGQAQISVMNLNQPVTLSLTPSSTEGVAPHTVNFEWSAAARATPTEISIDYDGDGVFDQTTVDPSLELQHAYSAAAINNVTLRVTMPDGSVQTTETVIVTHAPDYIDAIFLSLWNGMNEALLANEPMVALNYLNLAGQGRFFVTFEVVAPGMQAIVDSYRTPARGEINGSYLEYIVPRSIDGSNLLYFVYCMKEQDGTWRIDSM